MLAERKIITLLERRGFGKSICPSEVAIAIAQDGEEWRGEMDAVHQAVDGLLAAGIIALSWKGKPMSERRGPYRIALRSPH